MVSILLNITSDTHNVKYKCIRCKKCVFLQTTAKTAIISKNFGISIALSYGTQAPYGPLSGDMGKVGIPDNKAE
jgi:hypothetical protein